MPKLNSEKLNIVSMCFTPCILQMVKISIKLKLSISVQSELNIKFSEIFVFSWFLKVHSRFDRSKTTYSKHLMIESRDLTIFLKRIIKNWKSKKSSLFDDVITKNRAEMVNFRDFSIFPHLRGFPTGNHVFKVDVKRLPSGSPLLSGNFLCH